MRCRGRFVWRRSRARAQVTACEAPTPFEFCRCLFLGGSMCEDRASGCNQDGFNAEASSGPARWDLGHLCFAGPSALFFPRRWQYRWSTVGIPTRVSSLECLGVAALGEKLKLVKLRHTGGGTDVHVCPHGWYAVCGPGRV